MSARAIVILLALLILGWAAVLIRRASTTGDDVARQEPITDSPTHTDLHDAEVVDLGTPLRRSQSTSQGSEATAGIAEIPWYENDEYLRDLREKWHGIHLWNTNERLREFGEQKVGTRVLSATLKRSGLLQEALPLVIEDFELLPEVERGAISTVLQKVAARHEQFGPDPFGALSSSDLDKLRAGVFAEALHYPTRYLVEALGADYGAMDATVQLDIADIRIEYLGRLAPLIAESSHRKTSALHLAQNEGFIADYRTVLHLPLLDPSYSEHVRLIQELEAQYRDEVKLLLLGLR